MIFYMFKQGLMFTFCMLCFSSCAWLKLADLSTTTSRDETEISKAKDILVKMGVAHGIDKWTQLDTYTLTFSDSFFGILGKNSHPFKKSSTRFTLRYIPNSYDGSLTFEKEGADALTWGIQSWKTYTTKGSGKPVFKQAKKISFWLPTYQYFIEMPMRIQRANAVSYAGEAIVNGKECEGVLASWNTVSAQKEMDQYLFWIDKESNRIVKVDYTIREKFKFLTGAVYFKKYKNYNGIILPSYMPVETNLRKNGLLHEMKILDFKANEIKKSKLRPDHSLPILGDEKK